MVPAMVLLLQVAAYALIGLLFARLSRRLPMSGALALGFVGLPVLGVWLSQVFC